jgi:hypothetical protein
LRPLALPVDIRALRAFSKSAKQIDIVLWLGYRLRNLDRPYRSPVLRSRSSSEPTLLHRASLSKASSLV